MKAYLLAVAGVVLAASPAVAQDTYSDGERTGFNGLYVGAAGGYNSQPSDGGSVLFDRNLDGRFGDSVLTGTGANAFSPGFCNGRAVSARTTPRRRRSPTNLTIPPQP
ncbi:hypothetical protein AB5I41_03625 [Sphingomonas sp. MMS24-JH45]